MLLDYIRLSRVFLRIAAHVRFPRFRVSRRRCDSCSEECSDSLFVPQRLHRIHLRSSARREVRGGESDSNKQQSY